MPKESLRLEIHHLTFPTEVSFAKEIGYVDEGMNGMHQR